MSLLFLFQAYIGVYLTPSGLRADTPSDLIIIDKNYLDRVNMRRKIIQDQHRVVHGCIPSGEAAVREIYEYLMLDYLPTRYPTIFQLSINKATISNTVTGFSFPTSPPASSKSPNGDLNAALRVLGETVEDDMFLLHETPDGHFTSAFVCCFPAGFNPSEKLGILLREVHGPVPSYEKIGISMEKFFNKLEVGKSVKRMNVSLVLCKGPETYLLSGGSGGFTMDSANVKGVVDSTDVRDTICTQTTSDARG